MKKIAKILSVVLCMVMVLGLMATTTFAAAADHLIINEIYVSGGNNGSLYSRDYIELYNPTDADINLSGYSIQYAGKKTDAKFVPIDDNDTYFTVNGIRVYVSATVPTGDIPDGSVGVGW